jgi:membrane-associated phospholipid phosphatase
MDIPFHDQQLQFMIDLTSHRISYLNPFFKFLNLFDSMYFAFLLIPFIWIGFSYRWGIRLFYSIVINYMINTTFKVLVGWPRPCTEVPEVGLYHFPSFGFPSGGAQISFFLGALLIYYWKSRYATACGLGYILLLSFSRLYLGVHYPIDILGGWAIAFILLLLFVKLVEPIEKFLVKKGLVFSFILSEALPLILFCLTHKTVYHRFDAMGLGLGVFLSLRYGLYLPSPKKISAGIVRGLIGVAGIFLLFFVLQDLHSAAFFGVISLWLSLVASPVCKRVFL